MEYCRNTSNDHYVVYFNIRKFSQPMFKSRKITKNPQSELKLTDANTDIS